MANYKLLIKPSAVKELETLPQKYRKRIVSRIQALSSGPRQTGCEKLTAQDKYRLRQGSYRILYESDDGNLSVGVVKVGHRR